MPCFHLKTLIIAFLASVLLIPSSFPVEPPAGDKMIGMYVHQHWPYNHPYAARSWSDSDWAGYLGGLSQLGFNTVLIWPMLDTMPDPLTESDRHSLAKIARVIDHAHNKLAMRVYIVMTPNVAANNIVAAQAEFEQRHFFHSDRRVNPGNPGEVASMMASREAAFRPLAAADGVVIIDSDPGGYPGSTNAEFVNLLVEHRKMFDRVRPGIELIYWMHAGWPGYCRYYETYTFKRSSDAEFEEALSLLKAANPEPWGVANNEDIARRLGIDSRVINLRYGQIEQEPSFPLTSFEPERAYKAGNTPSPRGVIGNAQSHCLQLPNTFAFVRGAKGQPVTDKDFVSFGEQLVHGQGAALYAAWKAIGGADPEDMEKQAVRLESLSSSGRLAGGPLRGLYFVEPARYLSDLALQLRMNATYVRMMTAFDEKRDPLRALAAFSPLAEAWQARHGYKNQWRWPKFKAALGSLDSPELKMTLSTDYTAATPYGKVMERYHRFETDTPRLLEAIRATIKRAGLETPGEK